MSHSALVSSHSGFHLPFFSHSDISSLFLGIYSLRSMSVNRNPDRNVETVLSAMIPWREHCTRRFEAALYLRVHVSLLFTPCQSDLLSPASRLSALFFEHPLYLARNPQSLHAGLEASIARYALRFCGVSAFPLVDQVGLPDQRSCQ